jgi:hypothetical protein
MQNVSNLDRSPTYAPSQDQFPIGTMPHGFGDPDAGYWDGPFLDQEAKAWFIIQLRMRDGVPIDAHELYREKSGNSRNPGYENSPQCLRDAQPLLQRFWSEIRSRSAS